MGQQSFINSILQNCRQPQGFWGRLMLWGMNKGHASLAQWGMSQLQWQPGWTVLDIGCGGGANLAQMLKLCPQGQVYGIDVAQASVNFSQRKNKNLLGTRCFVELGSAEKLPYAEQKFDVVTAFETIYFWKPLDRAFAETARVLKPGGCFLICCDASDPDDTTWTSRIEGMTVHSPEELQELLTQAGFAKINIYTRAANEICLVAQK